MRDKNIFFKAVILFFLMPNNSVFNSGIRILKKLLDKIFKLPPEEQRRDLSKTRWRAWLPPYYNLKRADIYLRYQIMSITLWLCVVLSLAVIYVFISKQDLRMPFLDIFYLDRHTVMALIYQFTRIAQTILFLGIFPFFIIKVHYNFNAKKQGIMYDIKRPKIYRGRTRMLVSAFGLIFFIMMMVIWSPRFTQAPILKYFYAENLNSLIIFLTIQTFVMVSWGALISYSTYLVLWRYIGPYDEGAEEYLDNNGRIITEAELNKRKD